MLTCFVSSLYNRANGPIQILLYLIRRCYGYTFSLMIASQPVSEALLPVYNQLRTLKRCLTEVKKNGGVQTVREVYPYSMKVSARSR